MLMAHAMLNAKKPPKRTSCDYFSVAGPGAVVITKQLMWNEQTESIG